MTNRLITKYKIAIVKIAQEVAKYLGYNCKKSFRQDHSKVAQYGHTVGN